MASPRSFAAASLPLRRFRPLRVLLLFALVCGSVVVYMTQPSFGLGPAQGSQRPLSADPARLRAQTTLLAQRYAGRQASNPARLDAAADYLRDEFARRGARVQEQAFETDGRRYRNIVASVGPEQGERIVVGAHYDVEGDKPGADDDASGVAGLLELAGLLAHPAPPRRIDLVAFTLEEPPFFASPAMGSAVHARSLKAAGVRLRAMVSLEMIGYYSDAPGSQAYPWDGLKALYPDRGNFVSLGGNVGGAGLVRRFKQAMTAAGAVPVYSLNAPAEWFGLNLSDQRNYWAEGYPALMVSDTAFFRNSAYHSDADLPERLDYGRMASVVTEVEAALRALAAE